MPNRNGKHRFVVGLRPRFEYKYSKGSHIPGHYINRYGKNVYRLRGKSRGVMNPRTGGFLGIELKFFDTARGLLGVSVTTDASGAEQDPASIDSLNSIAQGDTEVNRDGRQCILKSVLVQGMVEVAAQLNQTAAHPSTIVFIALVLDTQTNGAQLNSEDVYTNPSGTVQTLPFVFRNLQFISRFQILATRRISISRPTLTWDGTNMEMGGLSVPFIIYKKLNITVNFSNTSAVIANVTDNSLHVVAFSSSSSLVPRLVYNSRVRFVG